MEETTSAKQVPDWVREVGIDSDSFMEVISRLEKEKNTILNKYITSINDRRFDGKGFAVAYATDFSKISNQHFFEGKVRCLKNLGLEGESIVGEPYEGVFVIKFPFGIENFFDKMCEDENYFGKIAGIKNKFERKFEEHVDTAEDLIAKSDFHKIDVLDFYDAVNDYGSLNLDAALSYDVLENFLDDLYSDLNSSKKLSILTVLTTSPVENNIHVMIQFAKMSLLESRLKGEKPNIESFIDNFGYLASYDLKPGRLEYEQTVLDDLKILEKFYPTIESIRKEKQDIISKREVKKSEHEHMVYSVLRDARLRLPGKRRVINDVIDFIEVQQDYDENFRIARCRFFRDMRKITQHYFEDYNKPSIEDVANAALRAKSPFYMGQFQ